VETLNSLVSLRDSQQFSLTSDALPSLGDVCPVVYHRLPTNKHISDAFQYGATCSARIIKHSPRNQYMIPVIVFHFNKFFFEFIKMKNYSFSATAEACLTLIEHPISNLEQLTPQPNFITIRLRKRKASRIFPSSSD
jgi:hypothetical protein